MRLIEQIYNNTVIGFIAGSQEYININLYNIYGKKVFPLISNIVWHLGRYGEKKSLLSKSILDGSIIINNNIITIIINNGETSELNGKFHHQLHITDSSSGTFIIDLGQIVIKEYLGQEKNNNNIGDNFDDNDSDINTNETNPEKFTYVICNNSTIEIYWLNNNCTDKNIIVPNLIKGMPVSFIHDGAFMTDKYLESLTIPKSVHGIGKEIITYCYNLKTIYLETLELYYLNGSCIHQDAFITKPTDGKIADLTIYVRNNEMRDYILNSNINKEHTTVSTNYNW